MLEPCLATLHGGDAEGAWTLFVDRYRRLIFAVIRRYTTEPDEVMDVFAHICERLRADELARLRKFPIDPAPRASFSTWLVVVVRNLVVDWFRARDGRPRARTPDALSPLGKRIYDYLYVQGYSQREAEELVGGGEPAVSRGDYRTALREVHRAVLGAAPAPAPRHVAVSLLRDVESVPAQDPVDPDAGEQLRAAMGTLDPGVQLAIQMFVVDEVPAPDIARALGLPNAKAVYNKVYRGLSALRDTLTRRGLRRDDL